MPCQGGHGVSFRTSSSSGNAACHECPPNLEEQDGVQSARAADKSSGRKRSFGGSLRPASHGNNGSCHALVVTGHDGVDEISIAGLTQVSEAYEGRIETRHLAPEEFGLSRAKPEALIGGDVQTNAQIIVRILEGEQGPHRDMVLANTSAALRVAGLAANLQEGVEMARQAIDSGAARRTLLALREFTHNHRG